MEGHLAGASWIERVLSPDRVECTSSIDLRGYVERALRSGFPEPIGPKKLIAIEVKATSRPRIADAAHLYWLREQLGDQVRASVVLHAGGHVADLGSGVVALPIASLWTA